jgi:hypothetical protein
MRPPIPKLAASAVAPLQTVPRFQSELLRSGATWPQEVNYLRDTYGEIFALWESLKAPGDDKRLYEQTEPLLRELLLGISKQLSTRIDIYKATQQAQYNFETASSYARAGDYAVALIYDSYSLMKLHRLLDGLTAEANRKQGSRKLGYGYDSSGEQGESGGTSGNDRHLWDSSGSPKHDHTSMNPANMLFDVEAEADYKELAEFKHKRVYWPPRTR